MSPKAIISQSPPNEQKISDGAKIKKTKKNLDSRKSASVQYAAFLERTGMKRGNQLERVRNSGNYLELVADRTDEHSKVFAAFLSGDRWDPMQAHSTAAKKSLRLTASVRWILHGEHIEFIEPEATKEAEVYPADAGLFDVPERVTLPDLDRRAEVRELRFRILFVTLTIPNCTAEELADKHKLLSSARRKLLHDFRALRRHCRGYVCTEEVTYNAETRTYHPHLHLLVAVTEEYFASGRPAVTQAQLVDWWKKATDAAEDEYRICDIRTMSVVEREEDGYISEHDGVFEVCKYITKSCELLAAGDDVMQTVIRAYKGQKQSSCAGIFRDAFDLYERGELTEYVAETEDGIEWATKRAGTWGQQRYSWSAPVALDELEAAEVSAVSLYERGELACELPEADQVVAPLSVADGEADNREALGFA